MLESLPTEPEEVKLVIIDDELNKLYIDTQHLLQKYSSLVSENTPLLVNQIKKALKDLDFIFENLNSESEGWEVNSCKREYKYWHKQLTHFEELEKERQRELEREKRWELEKAEAETAKLNNRWINEMRVTYCNNIF
jgi:hypothetical protein